MEHSVLTESNWAVLREDLPIGSIFGTPGHELLKQLGCLLCDRAVLLAGRKSLNA